MPMATARSDHRLRHRRSLAEIERAFEEEIELDRIRRERLSDHAKARTRARKITKAERTGTVRFSILFVALTLTVVVVVFVMFETLALLVG